jgi:hypothetical protein
MGAESAREHIADVHNRAQMLNACAQLRREVVIELAARGLVPSYYCAAITKTEAPRPQPSSAPPDECAHYRAEG